MSTIILTFAFIIIDKQSKELLRIIPNNSSINLNFSSIHFETDDNKRKDNKAKGA